MPVQAQLWTLNGLSVELKIYRAKLAEALETLPPDHEIKGEKRWLLRKVVDHLYQNQKDAKGNLNRTQQDARLKQAQADLKELDLAQRRGELVEVEEVGSYTEALVRAFRQRVLAIPRRLAPVLAGKKAKDIELKTKKELSRALDALSKLNPDDLVKRVRAKSGGKSVTGFDDEGGE